MHFKRNLKNESLVTKYLKCIACIYVVKEWDCVELLFPSVCT